MLTYQDVLDAKSKLDVAKAKLAELSEDYDAKDRAAAVPPEMHYEWVAAGRARDAAERALKLMADAYLTQCARAAYCSLYEVRDRLAGKPLWYKRTAEVAKGAVPSFESVVVSFGSMSGLTLSFAPRALPFDPVRHVPHEVETFTDPAGGRGGIDRKWFAPAAEWPEPTEPDADRSAADVLDDAASFERRLDAVAKLRSDYVSAVRELAAPYALDGYGFFALTLERKAFDRYDVGCDFTL